MIVQGNRDLLNDKLAVVLNSSQSKTPCGNDQWVTALSTAITDLVESGYTIITSIGLITWELAVYLVRKNNGNQIVVSPYCDDVNGEIIFRKTVDEFGLDDDRAAMVFVAPETNLRKPKATWLKRDKAAISLANLVVPVSIRPGGRLQNLLETLCDDRKILSKYQIEYGKPIIRPPRYANKSIRFKRESWDYITHWTRTQHGPWPGQTKRDFYKQLLESENEYPNNAFNTLRNMAEEGIIRASSEKIRDALEVVGFTESSPREVLGQMRWLPKRVNWNFEPYGVAISKKAVSSIGIRPVIYGYDDDYERLANADRPYFQSRGQKDVDWSMEREWRHIGDLDLSKIPPEDLMFLVWCIEEADLLRKITKISILILSADYVND
jgi:hypothetical protein